MYPQADWEILLAKLGELLSRDHDWSADVAAIDAPAMLIYADGDAIRLEAAVAMYRMLGGGQRGPGVDSSARSVARLAIVPGATHYDILSTTAVAELAAAFLDTPLPRTR